MPDFDLESSLARAARRLERQQPRKPRSDRGQARLHPEVLEKAEQLLLTQERPPVRRIQRDLGEFCADRGLRAPARATVYELMARTPSGSYPIAELPEEIRTTLYNLSEGDSVPGHQLVFHCLNYGGLRAMSVAAGLPWLAIYQAANLRGWRPRSRGLLDAIRKSRKI